MNIRSLIRQKSHLFVAAFDAWDAEAVSLSFLLRFIFADDLDEMERENKVRSYHRQPLFRDVLSAVYAVSSVDERQQLITHAPDQWLTVFATVYRSPESIRRAVFLRYAADAMSEAVALAHAIAVRNAHALRVQEGLVVRKYQMA
jgi:hypothetical protein